jgi:hypothetical protein
MATGCVQSITGISLLTLSSGFVDQIFARWLRGKVVKASTSAFTTFHQRPDAGKGGGQLVAHAVPGRGDGGGVGLGEDGAEHRGDHVLVGLRHQGEQVAGEVNPATLMPDPWKARPIAATSPAC